MRNDLHIHMILEGAGFRAAIDRHRKSPDDSVIRGRLAAYRDCGVTFLRDGGDAWGVCIRAKQLAPEYGIDYRMPAFPIHRIGHYGGFIGRGYNDLKEYASLVREADNAGADFIKVMISGLMDFGCYGKLSEDSLPADEIREIIHIAHDKGLAVMAHCNGTSATIAACEAGVDSIEHGGYLEDEALCALAETGCVWVPTISAVSNLTGSGRFPDEELEMIVSFTRGNVRKAADLGVVIGCGSDAGASRVRHPDSALMSGSVDPNEQVKQTKDAPGVQVSSLAEDSRMLRSALVGAQTEEALLREALGDAADGILDHAEELVKRCFQRQS